MNTVQKPRSLVIILCLFAGACILPAKPSAEIKESDPLFELEEFVVNYNPTNFAPAFKVKSPQFTYYKAPDLKRGDLILALEFMDRYRENPVPGEHKWAGMLHFPVVDGQERMYLKWLCLYFYNDRMFGYDPSAAMEYDQRFFVPISYENRENADVLFQFASSYVEEVYPERTEEVLIYEEDMMSDFGDDEYDSSMGTETWESYDIPAGRIDSYLPSHKGKDAKDLVNLVYRFEESPNPGKDADSAYGRAEDVGKDKFTWKDFWSEVSDSTDYIEIARQMLAPRWSQKLYFHYTKDLWILPDLSAKASGLAFNIGLRIYVYSPKYGVWRTGATVHDLSDMENFKSKMQYPGIKEIDRVEFIPLAENQADR